MPANTAFGPWNVQVDDRVAIVTIDHPPSNLVDGPLLVGLIAMLDAYDRGDLAFTAAVFTSADPDFFLMHGDVESILAAPTDVTMPVDQPNIAAATFERLAAAPFLSIGALDGAARGGGAELYTALDVRYASDRSVLGQPEVPMGILPGAGGTSRLARLLGRARALEVILGARDFDAFEARDFGWIDHVLPSGEVVAEAEALARRVSVMPPASVAAVKRVVEISLGSIDAALVAETNEFLTLTASGQHRAPMERFLAAGGQTREGERSRARLAAIVDAMLTP